MDRIWDILLKLKANHNKDYSPEASARKQLALAYLRDFIFIN
jgi:hypothetical protein